jgi:hypothetical protein
MTKRPPISDPFTVRDVARSPVTPRDVASGTERGRDFPADDAVRAEDALAPPTPAQAARVDDALAAVFGGVRSDGHPPDPPQTSDRWPGSHQVAWRDGWRTGWHAALAGAPEPRAAPGRWVAGWGDAWLDGWRAGNAAGDSRRHELPPPEVGAEVFIAPQAPEAPAQWTAEADAWRDGWATGHRVADAERRAGQPSTVADVAERWPVIPRRWADRAEAWSAGWRDGWISAQVEAERPRRFVPRRREQPRAPLPPLARRIAAEVLAARLPTLVQVNGDEVRQLTGDDKVNAVAAALPDSMVRGYLADVGAPAGAEADT